MKGKTLYLAAVVILSLAVVFNLSPSAARRVRSLVRDALAPYQALLAAVGSRLHDRVSVRQQRRMLADTLTEREEELQRLRRDVLRLNAAHEENVALRRQLGYRAETVLDLLPCRVIARGDMTGWWRTLRVNRGDIAGVKPDMAVVSEQGLVGRVLQASRHTAEVLLISDASSHVAVRILPSGTFAILEGAAQDFKRHGLPQLLLPVTAFRADYISLREDIREGDAVVTSGLGGVFPPGLPVGSVAGVRTDSSGLYRRADVVPAADMARLDTLYVVRTLPHGETP